MSVNHLWLFTSFHISRKRNCLFAYDSITDPTQSHIMRVSCPGQSPPQPAGTTKEPLEGWQWGQKETGRSTASELRGSGYQRPEPFLFPRQRLALRELTRYKCLFSSLLLSGSQWNHCQWFSETEISQGKHKPHLEVFRGMWSEQCADSINAQVGPGNHSSEAGAWFLP